MGPIFPKHEVWMQTQKCMPHFPRLPTQREGGRGTQLGQDAGAASRAISQFQDFTELAELRLENHTLIDNVVVEFSLGLVLLVGKTCASKS
jgi:hypothetical protein